jgi:hypothetical protein
MMRLDRRTFLSGLAGSLVAASALRAAPGQYPQYPTTPVTAKPAAKDCWLEICAPFVVEDPALELGTEILLTATCFPGIEGFRDTRYGTEYQVELFDAQGREIPLGSAKRVQIPAMRPTVLRMGDFVEQRPFWGSARLRLAPIGGEVTHAGDLFSAGFVRWSSPSNFDNVHAHPAPPKQARGRFYYSMPFPPLAEYHCAFALFNPNDDESAGLVRLVEPLGSTVAQRKYRLRPRSTALYSLADLKTAESPGEALAVAPAGDAKLAQGGVVVVENDTEAVSFAYTLKKGRRGGAFSVEHPLHFAHADIKPARKSPFAANGSFPAEALLYTPLVFAGRRFGDLQLESRLYLSANRWREEILWLMPFVTDSRGMIAWVSNRDDRLAERITPREAVGPGVLKLGFFESCHLDTRTLPLEPGFSGGFGVATIPPTSHALMKVEVRATNWGRVAFTHFRPGGHFHRRYREVSARGGLPTDYIVSGCQVRGSADSRKYDCLLALMNIEFEEERAGEPSLQLFGEKGLVAEKSIGELPPLACRHYLVSELFPDLQTDRGKPLTVRMMDAKAMTVVSALHIDYERRDLALEHGSDRHSTYLDYGC